MALADAVQGSPYPGQTITWGDGTDDISDFTNMTANLIPLDGGDEVAVTGTLTVTDGPNRRFYWAYSVADVANSGWFSVQFRADNPGGQTPAKTYISEWRVRPSQI